MNILLLSIAEESYTIKQKIEAEYSEAYVKVAISYQHAHTCLAARGRVYDLILISENSDLNAEIQQEELKKISKFNLPILFISDTESFSLNQFRNFKNSDISVIQKDPSYGTLIAALMQRKETSGTSKEIVNLVRGHTENYNAIVHLKSENAKLSEELMRLKALVYGDREAGIIDAARDFYNLKPQLLKTCSIVSQLKKERDEQKELASKKAENGTQFSIAIWTAVIGGAITFLVSLPTIVDTIKPVSTDIPER